MNVSDGYNKGMDQVRGSWPLPGSNGIEGPSIFNTDSRISDAPQSSSISRQESNEEYTSDEDNYEELLKQQDSVGNNEHLSSSAS